MWWFYRAFTCGQDSRVFSSSGHFVSSSVRSCSDSSKKRRMVAVLVFDYKIKLRHEYKVQSWRITFLVKKRPSWWTDGKYGS